MSGTAGTLPLPPGLRLRVAETATSVCADDAAFARDCREHAGALPHAILLGGGEHECAARSIAALAPAMVLEAKGRHIRLHSARGTYEIEADPFEMLESMVKATRDDTGSSGIPCMAGYVGYEAGRLIERLPGRVADRLGLPDFFFLFPTCLRIHERLDGTLRHHVLEWSDDSGPLPPLAPSPAEQKRSGRPRPVPPSATDPAGRESPTLRCGFTAGEYMAAVERVRRHIREGDVYQVNLSQRFRFPVPRAAFDLWLEVFAANPAPFYAWIDAGNHQVLSASMERFVRVEGDRIETRPIKGTRPRGVDEAGDRLLEEELLRSQKDDAELSMIVDLERNDIGKVARPGSVRVTAHKRVERYANVMHLVSVVEGRLLPDTGFAAIFRALFPGGSITGCPKIRAMEIIDTLETETRHVYTGAIGHVTTDGGMDFNIAIRTAIVADGVCRLSVGGGIVHDSDPRGEYQETLHKGRTFFDLAGVRIEPDERQ